MYNCTAPCIVFTQRTKLYLFNINQSQPWVYSSNTLKISLISASIFLKNIFLKKENSVLRISNQDGDGKGDVIYKEHSRSSKI